MRSLVPVLALLLGACQSVPVHLGNRSVDPVPTGPSRTIEARACGFQLLLLIPIQVNNRQVRAYSRLRAQAAGAYITDVEVQEEWGYRLVGTEYCTILRARAIQPA